MKKFILLICMVVLFSCSQNVFEEILFRTKEDPFFDTPTANSLSLENTIFLKWREDSASDVFYLMRSPDQPNLNFTCVYIGQETSFVDSGLDINNRYIYRLDKSRGEKFFTGNSYAYGCVLNCRKDNYEDNNNEQKATLLEHDLQCNLPCVRYITENKMYLDEDWFYVTVPPKRIAEILISQKGLGDTSIDSETSIYLQEVGATEISVKQKSAIHLANASNETKKLLFRIYPKTVDLFSSDSFSSVIEYTISLNKIFNYEL